MTKRRDMSKFNGAFDIALMMSENRDLKQRIAALEAQNARLLALVREVVNSKWQPEGTNDCPFCGQQWGMSHDDTCWLARVETELEGGNDDQAPR